VNDHIMQTAEKQITHRYDHLGKPMKRTVSR